MTTEAESGSAAALPARKRALRERMAAARDAIPPAERDRLSARIAEAAIAAWRAGLFAAGPHAPAALACYIPFRSEADVMPIARWCWTRGVPVLAPRVDAAAKRMTLHEVAGEDELAPGAYGIREPGPRAPQAAALPPGTLMLVPGLAFDATGRRLGYGGGYYDRLLEGQRAALASGALTLAAVAFAAQVVDVVPTEPHDARVRFLITEDGVLDCAAGRRTAEEEGTEQRWI